MSYNRIGDVVSPCAIGNSVNALLSGTTAIFDEINKLTVTLIGNTELTSASEIAVLNGANAALIGSEIIQFRNASLIEPGKYELSGFLRGRLGTEWAVNTHMAGERFILLDGRISRQIMAANIIGLSRQYKAVSYGDSIVSAEVNNFVYTGVALKPYSPAHVSGSRDSGGNLTISWVRRARLGGNWQDNIDVPLNERIENYDIEIMNGGNVQRTFSAVSTTSVVYNSSQQIADFGSNQAIVSVKIYQISSIVGRGYPAVASV
jgi:hypothetical protein